MKAEDTMADKQTDRHTHIHIQTQTYKHRHTNTYGHTHTYTHKLHTPIYTKYKLMYTHYTHYTHMYTDLRTHGNTQYPPLRHMNFGLCVPTPEPPHICCATLLNQ